MTEMITRKNCFTAYHSTSIGASHVKSEKVCQDASASARTEDCSLAVVCDGHGGEDYFRSDKGSRMAADIFSECVQDADFQEQLNSTCGRKAVETLVIHLIKSVVARWNMAVEADLEENPLTEEELSVVSEKARRRYERGEKLPAIYGTTLIGFVTGANYCFGVQIGDGKCVTANQWGQLGQPIPWDEKCFLNVTTSLSDENAFEEFRFWVEERSSKDFPIAVFLGSDGIDDSFAGDLKLYDFYLHVLRNVSESDTEDPITDLFEYLPNLSKQGSGDDMSLGLLLDKNRIKQEKRCWEGKGKRILVENSGNMDTHSPETEYRHHKILPAEPGEYEIDTGMEEISRVHILSVSEEGVCLSFRGGEAMLTAREQLVLTASETQTSQEGPWYNAVDRTVFVLL